MRSRAFPVSLQIMMALRFYATGSFQLVNADVHNVSRSRVIRDVTSCLISVCQQSIAMPTDPANLQNIMQGFHNIANFPNVRYTHQITIHHQLTNTFTSTEKNYHSINIQGICDANMRFLNIVAN